MMDAYMSGPYRKEEIVKAEFNLPPGYKLMEEYHEKNNKTKSHQNPPNFH